MDRRSEAAREIVALLPVVAVNLRLTSLFDLQGIDLTANQLFALNLIALAPDSRMRAGEIAGRLGISSQAGTALVDRLVGVGVVARSYGEDRRVVWVSVTDEGRRLLEGLATGLQKLIEEAVESTYDAATLEGLLEGMRRVANFAGQIGGARARARPERPADD